MKKLLLFFCFFTFLISSAQLDFGIKAGVNYNSFNDLNITGGSFGTNEFVDSKNSVGYHFGIFSQFNLTKFYVRTELIYVHNKGSFDSQFSNASNFDLSTLELPVLVGFNIIKPLSFYIGPSLIYSLDSNFSDFFDLTIENDLSVGFNIGANFVVDKFGIDLRYSSGFSENTASYLDDIPLDGNGYILDTRPSQFLLSLSYKIN